MNLENPSLTKEGWILQVLTTNAYQGVDDTSTGEVCSQVEQGA